MLCRQARRPSRNVRVASGGRAAPMTSDRRRDPGRAPARSTHRRWIARPRSAGLPAAIAGSDRGPAGGRGTELQCTSHFPFLRGAGSAEEIFAQAAILGIEAVAIADRNTLAGIVRAH